MDSERQHSRIIGWQKGAAHMRTAFSIGDILLVLLGNEWLLQ